MSSAPPGFRAALAAMMPQLRGFARFLARDTGRADDLVQEALLRAMENEESWRPGTDLRAWIFRILRNVFLDQARRRKSEQRVLDLLSPRKTQAPEQGAVAELGELGRAVAKLPKAQREAIVLVSGLGFTMAEAAAVTGVAEGTLKARIFRARATLACRFGEGQ